MSEQNDDPADEVFQDFVVPDTGAPLERERPWMIRPMVFVALAHVAGLVVGRQIFVPWWSLILPAGLIALAVVGALIWNRRQHHSASNAAYLIFLVLALLGWASSNRVLRADSSAEAVARQMEKFALVRVEGRIAEWPDRRVNGFTLLLDHAFLSAAPLEGDGVRFPLKVSVMVYSSHSEKGNSASANPPVQGSRVVAWGRILRPQHATSPEDFDQADYLSGRGVGAMLKLAGPNDLEISEGQRGWRNLFYSAVDRVHSWMRANLNAALSKPQADVARALFLAERDGISKSTNNDFVRTGLAHLLCVSGLHTGFILLMVLVSARLMGLPPRWCALAGIPALAAYAALTGFHPAVLRASIMGAFLMGAWGLGRTTSIPSALATSAFFTLVLDPRNLIRSDWLLSYLCVGSVTLFVSPIYEILIPSGRTPKDPGLDDPTPPWMKKFFLQYIWLAFATVTAVQIGLLPITAAIFHQVSLIGFLIQPIAIFLGMLIVMGSVLIALLGWIAPVAWILGHALNPVIVLFNQFVAYFSSLPWASFRVHPLPIWLIALYYPVMLWGPHLLRGRGAFFRSSRRQKVHAVARVGLFIAVIVWLPVLGGSAPTGALEFYMLDVGQGDCLVLKFPDGKIGVVDGGKHNKGDRVVSFLRWLATDHVDFAVSTHADADHIGGLIAVLENFRVNLFIEGPDTAETDDFRELQQLLVEKKVKVHHTRVGERIGGLKGTRIDVLNPSDGEDNNDASVTLLMDYGKIEFLLTGDIEAPAEREILRRGLARDIDVLKVAHHGSATSSGEEFLDAFTPEIALISVGAGNPYGHPSPKVLQRFQARKIAVERTDQIGTLRLTTDGEHIQLDHFSEGNSPK